MHSVRSKPLRPSDFGVDRFTVAAVLDRRAQEYPDRVMMSIAGTEVTFEQMRRRSRAAADLLASLGVGRGDGVALFTGTCPEWVYFWLGAARIGAVSAAVNAANRGDFLLHTLRLSRAKVILTDAERKPRVDEVADRLDTVTDVVVQDNSLSRRLVDDAGRSAADDPEDADEVGALFYTSGTTGPSKAVATSWHYLFSVAATVATAWKLQAGEALWTAMPLFHLSAAPSVLTPMLVGGTTVLADSFHPGRVWDDIRAHGAVGFAGAGAMVSMLHNLPADARDAQLPLRFISAAPIDAASYHDIEKRYGCRIVTMYGLTEAFPIAVKGVADEGEPGTSGKPNPNFDVRIVDGDGNPLPAGTVGEIACRPRHPHVMSEGYVGDGARVDPHPEWFRTGDLGRLDADQNLTYLDRLKDSLRRRGENISSIEVERVVTQHHAVAEAAAIGVPSELGEDDILLAVTLHPDGALDYAELLDFCAARMPYFCVPRYVEQVNELPKNVIGRVRKDLLRAKGLTSGVWDREEYGYIVKR
ncbi:AMP-binding protein [Mycobacterium montefiorense]|uniref:ATP-dependent acyl-CoA ligase n=1 Tax=Mycobacterium montefiorense TaxID=154654 RepID=A0AA37UXD1_9MYCO|nr:AMP-binding protein [Mycobacterium montefiorense]GBG39654.1 ATP-dependent acyl-CoA ligase [Mycobacterium montefiorense]GKU35525.1 ATP-dependent acyl-CoA ligase [Mycobacterium montefiorense]GKU40530.1 ATP-dependent acyl-CoA ligase [Mycobacterium montefiorense]GKU45033.1 ATP-dependent acyl-CoA ligase [Mycobacterium montefiorense]GKU51183.1 ATP-dependent acyl-CoA ligase [Mycobacterium montefiorense]